jgi:predicted nucleic acid-binding protein
LIRKLQNKTLFLDTAPFIYFIEGHSHYHDNLIKLFDANDKSQIKMQTSTLTLMEVLVQPMKLGRHQLAEEYHKILTTSSNISIHSIDIEIAKRAAHIRASYNIKTPDAIQIACALVKNADYFLTNDKSLKKVKDLKILLLEDL